MTVYSKVSSNINMIIFYFSHYSIWAKWELLLHLESIDFRKEEEEEEYKNIAEQTHIHLSSKCLLIKQVIKKFSLKKRFNNDYILILRQRVNSATQRRLKKSESKPMRNINY